MRLVGAFWEGQPYTSYNGTWNEVDSRNWVNIFIRPTTTMKAITTLDNDLSQNRWLRPIVKYARCMVGSFILVPFLVGEIAIEG